MVKFSSVTGDSFTLQVAKDGALSGWIPLNMIQIEAIPVPSVALLGGLSALGLLVRRRRSSLFQDTGNEAAIPSEIAAFSWKGGSIPLRIARLEGWHAANSDRIPVPDLAPEAGIA